MTLPPLSVLDLIPLNSAQTLSQALRTSREFLRAADRLGFRRYWTAEHHNSPALGSTNPAVALAWLGEGTERIRLGSGGVMLPNHAPYVIAEQFALLEGMYPGRIDLGLGRAPGTDPITAAALRRDRSRDSVESYPRDVLELLGFLGDPRQEVDHETRHRLRAAADLAHRPEVWLLGSSLYSAELAGVLGLPFSFANHFSMNADPARALDHYRRHFEPSPHYPEPVAMVSVSALAAPTIERARELDLPARVQRYRLMASNLGPTSSPEEARAFAEQVSGSELWQRATGAQLVGTADLVRNGVQRLADTTGADEIMISTTAFDVADRIATLEALI